MIEIVRLKKLLRQYLTGQKAPDNDKKFLTLQLFICPSNWFTLPCKIENSEIDQDKNLYW